MNISSSRAFGNARKALIGLLLVGASCVSSQASAALVLFTLTGHATASFTLDQSPTPTFVNPSAFTINNVAGSLQGAPASINLSFRDSGDFFALSSNVFLNFFGFGVPLFSGTNAFPDFNLGTYSFNDNVVLADLTQSSGRSTLTITSVDGAVPEPSTLMTMLVGFGLLGGAMRYGRKANAGTQTASLT